MLNNRVREFRELHGLSQDELARRAGISPTVIVSLESGEEGYTPQMRTAIRLCELFNIDLGRLFWIEGIGQRRTVEPISDGVPEAALP